MVSKRAFSNRLDTAASLPAVAAGDSQAGSCDHNSVETSVWRGPIHGYQCPACEAIMNGESTEPLEALSFYH